MESAESKIINNFSSGYLFNLLDRVIDALDQMPSLLQQQGITATLNSVWEEICVQAQSENFDDWELYEQQIRDLCLDEIENEKPEVLSLVAFFVCSEENIIYTAENDYSEIIVDWMFADFIDRAEKEVRPSIQQYLSEANKRTSLFTSYREQFEKEAIQTAQKIIQQIEEGAGKFEMPWHKGMPFALNRYTGNMYSGMNQLRLWEACLQNNHPRNYWATFYQWAKLGGKVKAGSKSTKIGIVFEKKILANPDQLSLPDIPAAPYHLKKYMRFFSVFNMAQAEGHQLDQPDLFSSPQAGLVAIRAFIEKSRAKIKVGGDRAYYNRSDDYIQMPDKARFNELNGRYYEEAYHSVLLHELIHWTGHYSRCNRTAISPEKNIRYAFEELVAELGSAMLSTYFNQEIYPRNEHAQYLELWLSILKKDFSYFYQAQNQAINAINWLFIKTDFLPFQIKERPIYELNDIRFEKWNKQLELTDQQEDEDIFYQSIF